MESVGARRDMVVVEQQEPINGNPLMNDAQTLFMKYHSRISYAGYDLNALPRR